MSSILALRRKEAYWYMFRGKTTIKLKILSVRVIFVYTNNHIIFINFLYNFFSSAIFSNFLNFFDFSEKKKKYTLVRLQKEPFPLNYIFILEFFLSPSVKVVKYDEVGLADIGSKQGRPITHTIQGRQIISLSTF